MKLYLVHLSGFFGISYVFLLNTLLAPNSVRNSKDCCVKVEDRVQDSKDSIQIRKLKNPMVSHLCNLENAIWQVLFQYVLYIWFVRFQPFCVHLNDISRATSNTKTEYIYAKNSWIDWLLSELDIKIEF